MEEPRRPAVRPQFVQGVLIFAIATLAFVILFPIGTNAPEMSRKSVCMTNLREIGLAFAMYLNDHNAVLPCSATYGSSDYTYRKALGQLPPPAESHAKKQTIAQLLYPYKKNKELYFCLSDTSAYTHIKFLSYERYSFKNPGPTARPSYVLKKAINDAWMDPKIKARHDRDYLYPSDQVLFYERKSFHWGGDPISPNGKEGASFNVCYYDSHVKTVRLQNAGIEPDYYNFDPNDPGKAAARYTDPRRYADRLP